MHRLHFLTDLFTAPTPGKLLLALVVLVLIGGALYLVVKLTPTALVCIGIGLEVFSGNWTYMHIPLPLDRIFLLTGAASMILGGRHRLAGRSVVLRPVHILLLVVTTWVVMSAIAAHTIASHAGFYALLDRLGLIPFVLFLLAPLLFGDEHRRNMLLATLTIVGAYLAVTAVLESLGAKSLIFPRYITNPAVGIHYDRARGPFVSSDADGLAMIMCAVAAGMGFRTWRRSFVRWGCGFVVLVSGVGTILTLTRSVWISAAVVLLIGLLADRRTRKLTPVIAAGVAAAVAILIFSVPGLHSKVTGRAESSSPVWDRENTDAAALRAVEAHPLFGIGWQTFETKGPAYLQQSPDYPLTGAGLEVHNVILSHAAELGLPGSILWVWALLATVLGALGRRGPPELFVWRVGLLCVTVAFLIVANLSPLSYAFPNLLIWLWAAIAANGYLSRPARTGSPGEEAPETPALIHA